MRPLWSHRLRAQTARGQGVLGWFDLLTNHIATYAVPVAVGVITVTAFVAWEPNRQARDGRALQVRVFEEAPGTPLGAAQALQHLESALPVDYLDTKLSEAPFWFSLAVQPGPTAEPIELELPSRHAIHVECWRARDLSSLGKASLTDAMGGAKRVKAGFAFDLGAIKSPVAILCRGLFLGPARISAAQWSTSDLRASAQQFQHNWGLLEGGLMVLSVFALLIAIVTREWLYVLYSGWLLASMRLGAMSAGWDTQWFERTIPVQWLFLSRELTVAALYALSYALFNRLFGRELKLVDRFGALRLVQGSCVGLIVAALTLPFSTYIPVMWVAVALGVVVIVSLLARMLWVTRSRAAMWYSASFGIVLLSGLAEVTAAAFGFKQMLGVINSVTAALLSSLTTALAITEQIRQERNERVRAQAELKDTYEALPIGLFTLSTEGFFTRVNPALTSMLGVDPTRNNTEHWSDHFGLEAWARLLEAVRKGTPQEIELRSRERDHPKWFFIKAALTQDKIDGSLQDVSARHEATERLHYLADNDPLTGVLNRRGIEHRFADALADLPLHQSVAIAYLDLDRFKLINDLFGHLAGDEVLNQVCARACSMLGERHSIGRVGGDEFVIVFRDTPMRVATAICRGIVEAIGRSPYQIGEKAFQVKGSIGLIEAAGGTSVKDAISMADRACREAKDGGHDGLVFYDRDASAFAERRRELQLVEQLGSGAAPKGLFLLMQPIMSLGAPFDSLNFEVLLRMREASGAVTHAATLISAAEKNGVVAVIDRWVLQNTLAWLEQHHDALHRTRFACVNLSGGSLNDEKFVADAFAMLARYGRAAERLCIEITESVALHDLNNTKRFIQRVREFGAKIALDDFGAGYTSFSYLKELPADAIKIDGSLVSGLHAHPANLAIVHAVVELAGNLGMRTIAEWAEDRATLESLARIGVDYVQGYAVSRPLDPARILAARSSAALIEDERVARFVRDAVVQGQSGTDPWEARAAPVKGARPELH